MWKTHQVNNSTSEQLNKWILRGGGFSNQFTLMHNQKHANYIIFLKKYICFALAYLITPFKFPSKVKIGFCHKFTTCNVKVYIIQDEKSIVIISKFLFKKEISLHLLFHYSASNPNPTSNVKKRHHHNFQNRPLGSLRMNAINWVD